MSVRIFARPLLNLSQSCFLTFCIALFPFIFAVSTAAQAFPSEIRGYKLHNENITITDGSGSFDAVKRKEPSVSVGQPDIVDVSLSGLTLAVAAELNAIDKSGAVHFMTFRDFRVNGMPVEIEEYSEPFAFRKGEKILLPKPATMFLSTGGVLNAAWKEVTDSKKEWAVTGTVFVFGKFRKFGFAFKRVVPVGVKLTIRNPL